LTLLEQSEFDVAIFDLCMPSVSGIELLRRVFGNGASAMQVLLLTGEGTIESAVAAIKVGAYDYLLKPCKLQEIERRCLKAYEAGRLTQENRNLRSLIARSATTSDMIGSSPRMKQVFRMIERIAPSDKPVLIEGESGTGKELVAQSIYRRSRRSDRPFVTVNCAALPEKLVESELFGHEKGAFTGATAAKPGLFELAHSGTLFIDEVGELPMSLQAKLLRVLEDGSFRRVGSVKEQRVDVRILAATNRNLATDVAEGRFREDLFYRINILSIQLPPLRERSGDVYLIVQSLLGSEWNLADEAEQALLRYDWPGNVRQLRNAIERARVLADNETIRANDLPSEILAPCTEMSAAFRLSSSDAERKASATENLASLERAHVLQVLAREGGNKTRAARVLGVDRRTL
jgi:DNA-binding NtrC family response regulator